MNNLIKEQTKCKNCEHQLEKMDISSFVRKYGNLWVHKRHQWRFFNPLRRCFCGCLKPEPEVKK